MESMNFNYMSRVQFLADHIACSMIDYGIGMITLSICPCGCP